jgi:hypothetical protein
VRWWVQCTRARRRLPLVGRGTPEGRGRTSEQCDPALKVYGKFLRASTAGPNRKHEREVFASYSSHHDLLTNILRVISVDTLNATCR